MGRFATTVEFYSRYREPYSPQFCGTVARKLRLNGSENLLDVGCGPGLLALGFAPLVGRVTAIDPETAMLDAARAAAEEAGVAINFVASTLEQFSADQTFEIVTIGRALHWLNREAAAIVLDKILAPAGHIVDCGAFHQDNGSSLWGKAYEEVRSSYAVGDESIYGIHGTE